ncbi:concanavalin A-like lectin/glucanase domain-containing protein [Cercophora samala]|uniref:Crh-like protein n=1 Tax=Cercophora samala TaxID=330535 RepID=A0AA40DAM1_9PEZI|nr:concanavalin A-like lectin/glucanase domain-containing protein [Cercophora samala]
MHCSFSPSWPHLLLSAVGLLCALATAQTYTSCNPTAKSCPPDVGLPVPEYSVDFRNGPDSTHWSSVGTGSVTYTPNLGAAFTINKQGDSPTMETSWYFFFGRAEVHMRAASGTGIVSCVVLESDDLDEIDWEWIGGEPSDVQTNYFGKGNTTTWDRGGKTPMGDSQGLTHNYTIDWTPSLITWYIDGAVVRTLAYQDALGGHNFPQTPMRLKLGIWAGGDSNNPNGTIDWAGGVTNYTQGPFTMYVESVSVTNLNPAASYLYSDLSGSWNSISMTNATTGPVPSQAPKPKPVGKSGSGGQGREKGTNKEDKAEITSDEKPFATHNVTGTASGVASSATGFVGHSNSGDSDEGNRSTATTTATTTKVSAGRATAPANIISRGSTFTTGFGLVGLVVCTVGTMVAV